MKVYRCPDDIAFPEPDYKNYDTDRELAREREHQEKLAEWLRKAGYTGAYTGRIYRTPVGDGYACYMLGDKGKGGVLIHLPYGDAYDSRDVSYLPKAEIIQRIEADAKLAAMFSAKRAKKK